MRTLFTLPVALIVLLWLGAALYTHAQELKASLATATTAEGIAAIHW